MKKIYSLLLLLCFSSVFAQIAITSQPVSQYVCSGATATFSVSATGNSLSYQWYHDGNPVPGAATNVYTISNVVTADEGNYTCVVMGPANPSVYSSVATLTVNEGTVIISQTEAVSACYGEGINLTVTASGNNLSYQWFKGNTFIGGADSNTYTIPFADFSSVGNYHVEVMNMCQSLTSGTIAVTVNTPPQINTVNVQPEACAGETVNMSVSASGTNLSYQWFHNDVLVSGQSNFSIANCTAADSGIYQIVVMNGCAQIFSYVNLNVNTPVAPDGAAVQGFTLGETLADLEVTGSGIKWYATESDAANHINPLPLSTLLITNTNYYATQTAAGICESNGFLAVLTSLELGVGDFNTIGLAYYPNPVTSVFNFDAKEKITAINVVNMLGQRVAFEKVDAMSGIVDLSALPAGNYIVSFSFGNAVKQIQLLKK